MTRAAHTGLNFAQDRERHGLLRVAAVTPEVRLGDVEANVALSLSACQPCVERGCRVMVLPELGLTGYSCGDLFYQEALQRAAMEGLREFCRGTVSWSAVVVVGLPWRVRDRLYNVGAVVARGRLLGVIPKTFLPNANEFYERRWFSPASSAVDTEVGWEGESVPFGTDLLFAAGDFPGLSLAVEICEDLWSVNPPSGHAALAGGNVIANLSASDELLGKKGYRASLVTQQSARCLSAYLYAGAGPGESSTDVVYSGHNMIAENGVLLAENDRFHFDATAAVADVDLKWLTHERLHSSSFKDETPQRKFRTVTFKFDGGAEDRGGERLLRTLSPRPFVPEHQADRGAVCREIFAIQAVGLARRLQASHAKVAVVGLSGGLDSTLALLVMVEAARRLDWGLDRLLAVTLPGFGTSARTRNNVDGLATTLGVPLRTISIEAAVRQHFEDIGHPPDVHDVVYENSQARERTQILMDIANQVGGIVVGTGDLSEAALGWCTFNGDHMSMYHVNIGVPKTLVRHLIEWCADEVFSEAAGSVLRDVANTPISPELLPLGADAEIAQKTEEVIGPYELHDFFLYHLVRRGSSAEKIQFLARMAFAGSSFESEIEHWFGEFMRRFLRNQFKRSVMPDGPKVGSVALSPRGDWRMPSDWDATGIGGD